MPATITNPLPSGNRGVVPSKWQRRPAAEAFGDRDRPGCSRRRPADGIPLSRENMRPCMSQWRPCRPFHYSTFSIRHSNLAPPRRRVTLPLVSDSPPSTTPDSTPTAGSPATSPIFATTHWSVVLSAARHDTTRARNALAGPLPDVLARLHAFVRRRGFPPQDAEDLTQEFFARLLEHNWIARADAQKGRFRTFLLTALNRFLAGEWDKSRAQKRGGGQPPVSAGFRGRRPIWRTRPARWRRT